MTNFMQKCGIVCTSLLPNERKYFLNCEFCDCLFTQLDNFIQHIEYKHQSNFNLSETVLDGTLEKLEVTPLQEIKQESEYLAEYSSPNILEFEHMVVDIKKDVSNSDWSYIEAGADDTEVETNNVINGADFVYETSEISEIIDDKSIVEKFKTRESDDHSCTYDHFVDINNPTNENSEKLEEIEESSCEEHNILKTYGKDMLLKILLVCENYPILWDKTTPHANDTSLREAACQRIADIIGKPNDWGIVCDIIQRLPIKILNQIRKKQLTDINEKSYNLLWENNIVAFLKSTTKNKSWKIQEGKENNIVKKSTSISNKAMENASKGETATKSKSGNDYIEQCSYECSETGSDFEPLTSSTTVYSYGKETMVAIFTSYTHHGILWDVNDPMYKNKKMRQKAYMSIASEIGKASEWRTILEIIQRYRVRLQKELKKKKIAALDNEQFIPSWEQDMTSFLTLKSNTTDTVRKIFKIPESKLSDVQCLDFIEIYKSFKCLWDEQDIAYRFNNRRREALASIQDILKSNVGVNLTKTELESEIMRIRKICSQEKYRRFTRKRSSTVDKPDCEFYDKIIFLEVDVGPFQCSVCGELVRGVTQYKIHKSTHDGSMPFNCVVCQQGYNTIGNLVVHLRRHTRDYEFECDVCKKRFATSTDLKRHERAHTGERPYFCDICGQSFKSSSIFITHSKRHQNIRSHKCDVCSKKFFSRSMLISHLGTHLTIRSHICNVCGKGFKIKKHLRQHKQIHDIEKKYSCKICGKQFAQGAGLTSHMKTHGRNKISGN